MNNKALLTTGVVGTVLAALCCFTPVLVVVLGAVGLSAVVGYLDVVLLPALAIFVGITLVALWRRKQNANANAISSFVKPTSNRARTKKFISTPTTPLPKRVSR